MSATPAPRLSSLHPELRERLRKLESLERGARQQRRDRWRLGTANDEDNQGEGWMVSYLDLVTLMLVMLVVLLGLSRLNPTAEAGTALAAAEEQTPAVAMAQAEEASAPTAPVPANDGEPVQLVADAAALAAAPLTTEADAPAAPAEMPAAPDTDTPAPSGLVTAPAIAPDDAPTADALPAFPAAALEPPAAPDALHAPVLLAGTLSPVPQGGPMRWTLPGFADFAERHAPPMPADAPLMMAAADSAPIRPAPAPAAAPPTLAELGLDGLGEGIDVILNEQSVSFRISNEILFPSGQADLSGAGPEVIGRLADAVARHPYPLSVEGHTDVIPIQNNRFPSNWELSTARATSVLRQLVGGGVASDRLRAVGWAHTRPIADNGTAEGRATNRRVELIMDIPPRQPAPAAP